MERDIHQKMESTRLFWFWGYVPDIDVKLFHPGGTAKTKLELTDIDVLGFKVSPELHPQRIVADCKTKKKESPINRAFWLNGVMGHLGMERGFVVLSREIEIDHRIAAHRLGITLINDDDFKVLTHALMPSQFGQGFNLFNPEIWQKFFSEAQSQNAVGRLWDYRRTSYWQDAPQDGLRHTLMEVRTHRKHFEQKNRILNNIFLDMMTAFSVSMSLMLSEIFQVYLVSNVKEKLDSQMKAYVYGGRGTYEYLNNLNQLMRQFRGQITGGSTDGKGASGDALALPEWEQFLQLFRTSLDSPVDFFEIPRLLKYVLFERLVQSSNIKPMDAMPYLSSRTVKLSLDLLRYFSAATMVPEHVWMPIRDVLDDILVSLPTQEENLSGNVTQETNATSSQTTVGQSSLDI